MSRLKSRPPGMPDSVWRGVCSCPGIIPIKEMDPNLQTSLVYHKNCGGLLAHLLYNVRECWNCDSWYIVPKLPYDPVDCPDCIEANR